MNIYIFILLQAFYYFGECAKDAQNLTIRRRILNGEEAVDTRPYMVYLRAAADTQVNVPNWTCGGVIVDERYIITSAACVEDAKQFYVISGTHRWYRDKEDCECIKYGAMKAIWKCVPKSYVFDGNEFDNIRWLNDDIAVVKVEDSFNFEKRVRGCDFIPAPIAYNNRSEELETPGTSGSIAGWGSTSKFSDVTTLHTPARTPTENSPVLLDADVKIIPREECKRRWPERYHYIIDNGLICTKDAPVKGVCDPEDFNCKELVEDDYGLKTNRKMNDEDLVVHTASHKGNDSRRTANTFIGGFCENDHGGPLIVGQGRSAVVVGIIAGCLTRDQTRECHGPFLYTSVWKHRNLINCAVDKDMGFRKNLKSEKCRRLLKSSRSKYKETVYSWSKHRDGPSKVEQGPRRNKTGRSVRSHQGRNRASLRHNRARLRAMSLEVDNDDDIEYID